MTWKKILLLSVVVAMISAVFFSIHPVTASGLDITGVDNFAILSNTYVNPGVASTIIIGDLGYITPPEDPPPTVTGTIYVSPDPVYTAAEAVQASLLADANNPVQTGDCTTQLGATDLTTISPLTPGVYCFSGAVSIGAGGITLDGNGVYIFRIVGALDVAASSHVTLTGNAKTNDVFWVPSGLTTIGANSVFAGNLLTDAATTMATTVSMSGRILSSNTVTTTGPDDVITATTCGLSPSPASLDYGNVDRGEQSVEQQLILANTGSLTTLIQVKGNDWTGNDILVHLAVGKTRYAFGSTGTPDPAAVNYLSKVALTTDFAGTDAVIPSNYSNSTYWQLEVSNMQNLPYSGTVSQTITFVFSCL